MTSRIRAVVTHRFPVSAELVYDAWLNPEMIRLWMAAALQSMGMAGDIRRVEVDARVGGRFFFSDQRGDLEAQHWGSYLELDRPHRIVFTWITDQSEESDPSMVTLTLVPDGPGTQATIVHEMDAQWGDYIKPVEDGWGRMLAAVGSCISQ